MVELWTTKAFEGEFSEKRKQYEEACKWLDEELGLKSVGTRFSEYEKILKTFANPDLYPLKDNDDQLKERFTVFMSGMSEAYQFIRLWNTFKSREFDGFKERVKSILKGQTHRASAIKVNSKGQNDDPARDIAYELNVASRFIKAGFDVDLTQACDIVATDEKKTLFIECKRLKSLKKLKARTSYATTQVDKRIGKNRKNKYGLIALDVTDLLLPKAEILIVPNVASLNYEVRTKVTNFVREQMNVITSSISRDIVGVLAEYSSSSFIANQKDKPILGHARSACVLKNSRASSKGQKFIDSFQDQIGNQSI